VVHWHAQLSTELGRGVIENRHSTDVELNSPRPRVRTNIHPDSGMENSESRVQESTRIPRIGPSTVRDRFECLFSTPLLLGAAVRGFVAAEQTVSRMQLDAWWGLTVCS